MTVTVIVVGVTPISGDVSVAVLQTAGAVLPVATGTVVWPGGGEFVTLVPPPQAVATSTMTTATITPTRSRIVPPGSIEPPKRTNIVRTCRSGWVRGALLPVAGAGAETRPFGRASEQGPHVPVAIPTSRYVSPEFARRERDGLWPRVWQLACSLDHVANPGDSMSIASATSPSSSSEATTAS